MSQHARNNPDRVPVRMDRFAPPDIEERELDPELQDELEEKRASRREDLERMASFRCDESDARQIEEALLTPL